MENNKKYLNILVLGSCSLSKNVWAICSFKITALI